MKVEISIGELLDKVSILSIKLKKIKNSDKLKNIQNEYNFLVESMKEIGIDVGVDPVQSHPRRQFEDEGARPAAQIDTDPFPVGQSKSIGDILGQGRIDRGEGFARRTDHPLRSLLGVFLGIGIRQSAWMRTPRGATGQSRQYRQNGRQPALE